MSACPIHLWMKVLDGKLTVHTEIPYNELALTDKIGEGGGGAVWRGLWGTKHVAIKVLLTTNIHSFSELFFSI
jgi:hypothetical protein